VCNRLKDANDCQHEFVVVDIRLAGSQLAREGRLEVKVAGKWGTICDDAFDDVDAGVACSMLGLGYVAACENLLFAVAVLLMV